jgi:putative addiction module killer protein
VLPESGGFRPSSRSALRGLCRCGIGHLFAASGESPFAEWFEELDATASAKIARMEQGNLSKVKSVGEGVQEYRIDFGPGHRIYFGRDGETIIILLTGGTKKRQRRDINEARACWQDYKRSKRGRG